MKIFYAPDFVKKYKRVSPKIKLLTEKREDIFRKNPHDPRLKTHSLGGKFVGRWSFSINHQYRIVFRFEGDDVWFLDIGTHSVYK